MSSASIEVEVLVEKASRLNRMHSSSNADRGGVTPGPSYII
jgi:hypothetical protein